MNRGTSTIGLEGIVSMKVVGSVPTRRANRPLDKVGSRTLADSIARRKAKLPVTREAGDDISSEDEDVAPPPALKPCRASPRAVARSPVPRSPKVQPAIAKKSLPPISRRARRASHEDDQQHIEGLALVRSKSDTYDSHVAATREALAAQSQSLPPPLAASTVLPLPLVRSGCSDLTSELVLS